MREEERQTIKKRLISVALLLWKDDSVAIEWKEERLINSWVQLHRTEVLPLQQVGQPR